MDKRWNKNKPYHKRINNIFSYYKLITNLLKLTHLGGFINLHLIGYNQSGFSLYKFFQ